MLAGMRVEIRRSAKQWDSPGYCEPHDRETAPAQTPDLIKYVYFGPAVINEFDTQSSTIFGHANAVGAEAVGAAQYSNTPAFSVFPPILESFSSIWCDSYSI